MVTSRPQALSPTSNTDVKFGVAGKAQLISMFPTLDPAMWDLTKVTFAPNAAVSASGVPATQAAIIPVPAQYLPAPLPPGLNHQLDVAVMAPGATNFDVPAAACFPNLPDPDTHQPLPPGAKAGLYSFNHDTGMWEVVGSMTTSADGKVICTDAGVGIRAPGWHGTGPTPAQPDSDPCLDYAEQPLGDCYNVPDCMDLARKRYSKCRRCNNQDVNLELCNREYDLCRQSCLDSAWGTNHTGQTTGSEHLDACQNHPFGCAIGGYGLARKYDCAQLYSEQCKTRHPLRGVHTT